ncbi:MAG: hypothetical protein ACYS8Z_25870 [Planctomycetota bacterium]|jgi:hypothetical protein
MMTATDSIVLLFIISGIVVGMATGYGVGHEHGAAGTIIGTVAGVLIGAAAGMLPAYIFCDKIPTIVAIRRARKRMAHLTVDQLVDRLHNHPYFDPKQNIDELWLGESANHPGGWPPWSRGPNPLFMELRLRGEDMGEHISLVLGLLKHESVLGRDAGFQALRAGYPRLVKYIRGYDSSQSVDLCREKVARLREAIQSPSARKKGDQA